MSSNIQIPKICGQCGKDFIARTTVTKCCSARCRKKFYKKKKTEEKIEAVGSIVIQKKEYIISKFTGKEYLSISEVCDLLSTSRMTLYRRIKAGDIKAGKLGNKTIIKRTEIEKLFI